MSGPLGNTTARPVQRVLRWARLAAAGGIVCQVAAGGCQQTLSSLGDALANAFVEGLGNSLASLTEALLLRVLG